MHFKVIDYCLCLVFAVFLFVVVVGFCVCMCVCVCVRAFGGGGGATSLTFKGTSHLKPLCPTGPRDCKKDFFLSFRKPPLLTFTFIV